MAEAIQIPTSEKTAEEILKETQARPPEEVVCNICGFEAKNPRGLKYHFAKKHKGKKPKAKAKAYDYDVYRKNLIAIVINKFLLSIMNLSIKENPMREEDCQIGEAIVYTMDYFGITPDHPVIILLSAGIGFGWTYFEHRAEIKKKPKEAQEVTLESERKK